MAQPMRHWLLREGLPNFRQNPNFSPHAPDMASSATRLNDALAAFLAGGPFEALWHAVVDAGGEAHPEDELSSADRMRYQAVYELVYMSAPDPVCPEDRAAGLMGAAELRSRLRELRLDDGVRRLPNDRHMGAS